MARNLAGMLPRGWDNYSPSEKISWFNSVGATVKELTDAGVPQKDINYMLDNGFNPGGTAEDTTVDAHIAEIYRTYLGREADLEGGNFYERQFGSSVEPDELRRFLEGAKSAGESLTAAGNTFLSGGLDAEAARIAEEARLADEAAKQVTQDPTVDQTRQAVAADPTSQETRPDRQEKKAVEFQDTYKLQQQIAAKYGRIDSSNINEAIKFFGDAGVSLENFVKAIGGEVKTNADGTKSVSYTPGVALTQDQIYRDQIAQIYQEELDRAPDTEGLNAYIKKLGTGATLDSIRAEIDASAEGEKFDQKVLNAVASKHGRVTQDNFDAIVKDLEKSGFDTYQIADAIGAQFKTDSAGNRTFSYTPGAALTERQRQEDLLIPLYKQEFGRTPDKAGMDFYIDQLAKGKTIDQIQKEMDASSEGEAYDTKLNKTISDKYGAITGDNLNTIITDLQKQGYSFEQVADAIGGTITKNAQGQSVLSYTPPAAAPKKFTNDEIQKLITDQFGSVTPENFQQVVNAVVGAGVPVDQFANVIGATIGTNDKGDTTLSLPPPPAQETKPLSLVDQLKAQQQVTGITHQASFSKDQDAIIKDMAEKLGKYGVQSLEDLKPITDEVEYTLQEREDSPGTFNLMRMGVGPEGETQLQYAGRTATPDEINQLRTKGTITENVGVLNARTGKEIPVNELNNAKGSGFTYYKIQFSPDGVAVPYGYKEATGAGALGDAIKSIVSIPPVAAALAAVAAPAIGSALSVSAPTAAAISAGTVGYAGSGRLDTAAKAAATAFAVTYAMQAAGLDLKGDAKARVDAFKGVEGYDSLTRTVDLGNGLTYDPVLNTINDANLGTITDVSTGEVNFKGVDGVTYDSLDNVYEIRNPDGSITKIDAATGQQTTTAKTTSGFGDAVVTKEPATLEELNRIIFGDEFVGTNVGEGAASTTIPSGQTGQTVTVTGARGTPTSVGAGAAQVFPVTTGAGITSIPLAPAGQNQVEVTAPKPGATSAAGAGAGTAATGSTTAQVEVTKAKPGDTGSTGAGAGAGTAGVGTTKTTQDTVTVTGKKGDTSSAGAGAATVTTKPPGALTTGTKKITDGKFTELTAEEVEALVKAGLLVTTLVGSAVDTGGVTIPTTNVDTTLINTIRPGVKVDLNPTIPGATTTTLTPGQQTYNLLGINAGTPTTQPTVPTTGIGSLPVPTYKPPPFLGGPAPGASRITPPVLTADPTLTQADFETAAKEIARQQAALPPITQPIPATPFESGLAKGTTVVKRAGGIVALRGGGIPMFQMGGPVAFAYGGMTGPINQPRMLSGGGDGMSDSIPATIEGTQPARLADGEFVVPADVVADIGNGSSKAGAKQLYAMMDRVRQARHGTTKQPPEVNMKKVLPV